MLIGVHNSVGWRQREAGSILGYTGILGGRQAEGGGREAPKAHKAEESLGLRVEGTTLSRALRQEQSKN